MSFLHTASSRVQQRKLQHTSHVAHSFTVRGECFQLACFQLSSVWTTTLQQQSISDMLAEETVVHVTMISPRSFVF
jgi:hypothetical protein